MFFALHTVGKHTTAGSLKTEKSGLIALWNSGFSGGAVANAADSLNH